MGVVVVVGAVVGVLATAFHSWTTAAAPMVVVSTTFPASVAITHRRRGTDVDGKGKATEKGLKAKGCR